MNEYSPSFKIYAKDARQAQQINNLFLTILNNFPPDKLEKVSQMHKKNPNLIKSALRFL